VVFSLQQVESKPGLTQKANECLSDWMYRLDDTALRWQNQRHRKVRLTIPAVKKGQWQKRADKRHSGGRTRRGSRDEATSAAQQRRSAPRENRSHRNRRTEKKRRAPRQPESRGRNGHRKWIERTESNRTQWNTKPKDKANALRFEIIL